MEIKYDILYEKNVVKKDIPKVASPWREKIRIAIENKLTIHPEVYGKPLRKSLAGYRKLRVGDYRIIFRIEKKKIKIFLIAHRREVYDMAEKRKKTT